MRAFELHRDEDYSGLSGVGKICEGIEFTDGSVAMCWVVKPSSIVIYPAPDGMAVVEYIHNHQGRTRVVWMRRIVVQTSPGEMQAEPSPDRPPNS